MKRKNLFLFSILFFAAKISIAQTANLNVQFLQEGKIIPEVNETIHLKKEKFVMKFTFIDTAFWYQMVNCSFDSSWFLKINDSSFNVLTKRRLMIIEDNSNREHNIILGKEGDTYWGYLKIKNRSSFDSLYSKGDSLVGLRTVKKYVEVPVGSLSKIENIKRPVYFVFIQTSDASMKKGAKIIFKKRLRVVWDN